jgi:hypothetical protein
MSKPQQPDAEIRAADFIQEADRNATPANDEGRVPVLEADGRLNRDFLQIGGMYPTLDDFSSLTVPQAVILGSDAIMTRATSLEDIVPVGFVYSDVTPEYINQIGTTRTQLGGASSMVDLVAPAGLNRVILINSYTGRALSGPSWNSISSIDDLSDYDDGSTGAFHVIPIGDSETSQTFNLSLSRSLYTSGDVFCVSILENVNQTSPIGGKAVTGASITKENTASRLFAAVCSSSAPVLDARFTSLSSPSTQLVWGETDEVAGQVTTSINMSTSSSVRYTRIACEIKPVISNGENVSLQTGNVVSNFSGLTPGAIYYLDKVGRGAIVTPAPAAVTAIRVGVALSTTNLLISISQ